MARPRKTERDAVGTKSWRKWSAKAWLSDLQVQLCSMEAKGLWIDILNLMMESPRVGHLLNPDGRAMSPDSLARVVRQPVDKVVTALKELRDNRVFSVDSKGVIFNRRMVREENEAFMGTIGGKKSVENRDRDQQGRLKPWHNPGQNHPTRDRERDRKKEDKGNRGDFGSQAYRGQPPKIGGMSLEEKQAFAHRKVADAIGSDGWLIVMAAADGNIDAKKLCKAKAKEIGVTWYDGKPKITGPQNGEK